MLKSIEVQGRTEDEAIELALQQLGMSRDDVSVEILETAKTGLFGLKNTPALIKVEYESDEEDPAPSPGKAGEKAPHTPASTAKNAPPATKSAPPSRTAVSARPKGTPVPEDSEIGGKITTYLKGLFERMDLEVSFELTQTDNTINVTLTAADPGLLIGRRGETLDALQHLTNYSVNRSPTGRVRIHLDAENYRLRRSEALENLAMRTAGKVMKYRRNMTLDPMNAYERHIIHAALQDHEYVSTFSIGNEANRRVVVAYGHDKAAQNREDSPQYKEWH